MRPQRLSTALVAAATLVLAGGVAGACAALPGAAREPVIAGKCASRRSALPFLHQRGTQIVDSAGHRVSLRGVDLGGWLLWEGWIYGGGYTSESSIMGRLASLVGRSAALRFHSDVERLFITETDVSAVAGLGFNVVRVPINYRILTSSGGAGWHALDNLVNWAQACGVYVVLDMHAAPGGQASGFIYDSTSSRLWGSQRDRDELVALWRAIASRYRGSSAIAGYDLLNEPWPWPDGRALVALYRRVIGAIRQVDARHMIVLEGALDSRDFSVFGSPIASNMVYSPHMYLWSQHHPQQQLDAYARLARRQHLPLWIGEFGENLPSEVAHQVAMFSAQPTVAGWAYWTWKQGPGFGVYQIPLSPSWRALIGWLSGRSARRPPAGVITRGMRDFLVAIQLRHESQGWHVVSALRAG